MNQQDIDTDLVLARRRYPLHSAELALFFFRSDRKTAGLGALDRDKRRDFSPVFRHKRREVLRNVIVYELGYNREAHTVYDPFVATPSLTQKNARSELSASITARQVPADTRRVKIAFDKVDQAQRNKMAAVLRTARRLLREDQS